MSSANRARLAAEVEQAARTIFKRCVECPKQMPVCPACAPTEECVLNPGSCQTCAHMICIAKQNTAPVSHGPNVGALAGGIIGGVAFVALVVFLIWRFWIKKRREQQDMELEEEWKNDEFAQQKRRTQYNNGGASDAASTRTRGSLANSILSRASNIIQIAYIPGVTNRGGSNSTSVYNPPVPPIPAAFRSGQQTPKSPLSNEGDALFFRPGDLRDSTWSDASSINSSRNRDTQYTMRSITPSLARSSVASDIVYYDETPLPANAAQIVAPRMVSIRQTGNSSPASGRSTNSASTPKSSPKSPQVMVPGAGSSAAGPQRARATQVTVNRSNSNKGKGKASNNLTVPGNNNSNSSSATNSLHVPTISSPLSAGGNRISMASSSSEDDEHARARKSLVRNSATSDEISPYSASSPVLLPTHTTLPQQQHHQQQPVNSPFFDATERPSMASSFASSSSSSNRPNPYASMASSITGRNNSNGVDSPLRRNNNNRGSIGGLSAVMEEASRRVSKIPSSESLAEPERLPLAENVESPFSDRHATE